MDIESLPEEVQKLFFSSMLSAIACRECEMSKKKYLDWCEEVWDSMAMNNIDDLKKVINVFAHKKMIKMLKNGLKGGASE